MTNTHAFFFCLLSLAANLLYFYGMQEYYIPDYKKLMRSAYLRMQTLVTTTIKRPWGYLFLNTDNPNYHQANHAIITNEARIDEVLEEIKSFYTNHNMDPHIYAFHDDEQLSRIKVALIGHGFTIDNEEEIEMMLEDVVAFPLEYRQTFKRLTHIDDEFIKNNVPLERQSYYIQALKSLINQPSHHFLSGFLGDMAVTSGVIVDYGFGIAVLENVETRETYRNKGYGSEFIAFATAYFITNMSGRLILAVDNPQAKHIYEKYGFRQWLGGSKFWTASLKYK